MGTTRTRRTVRLPDARVRTGAAPQACPQSCRRVRSSRLIVEGPSRLRMRLGQGMALADDPCSPSAWSARLPTDGNLEGQVSAEDSRCLLRAGRAVSHMQWGLNVPTLRPRSRSGGEE